MALGHPSPEPPNWPIDPRALFRYLTTISSGAPVGLLARYYLRQKSIAQISKQKGESYGLTRLHRFRFHLP